MRHLRLLIPIAIAAHGFLYPLGSQSLPSEQVEFFEKRIRPIFLERCQSCHNSKTHTAGLNLTSASGLNRGSDSGRVIVPGEIEASRLLHVVSYKERIKMPPTGKLKEQEIQDLREWVKLGAPWPTGPEE